MPRRRCYRECMAIPMLIIGYLLLEPPLLMIRRTWSQCIWPLYAVEVMGALMVAWGWALLGWPTVTVIVGAWAVGFGLVFPLHAARVERRRAEVYSSSRN